MSCWVYRIMCACAYAHAHARRRQSSFRDEHEGGRERIKASEGLKQGRGFEDKCE